MPARERLQHYTFDVFDQVISDGYAFERKNMDNLSVLREHQHDPAIVYFNHLAKDDPFLVMHLVKKIVPERLDNLVVPISERYSHFYNYPQYATLSYLGRKLTGFETPEVVQAYEIRGKNLSETAKKKREIKAFGAGRKFLSSLNQHLPQGALVVLSPEGHRSDDGALMPAEDGLGKIAKSLSQLQEKGLIKNGYFIPVSIVFPDYKGPKLHYNPYSKTRVIMGVGKPLSIEETFRGAEIFSTTLSDNKSANSRAISHYLMWRLSTQLPVNMRGVYGQDSIRDTLMGRYEIRARGRRFSRAAGVYDKHNKVFLKPQKTSST